MYKRQTTGTSGAAPVGEQDLPHEQQLEQEVAELRLVLKNCLWCCVKQIDIRSALKVAQVDLAAACSHMQQFQEIYRVDEAALSALNTMHDQYKTETEAWLTKNEVGQIKAFTCHISHIALHSWSLKPWKKNCAASRMIYNSLPASSPNCNAHWKKSNWLRLKIRRRRRIPFSP